MLSTNSFFRAATAALLLLLTVAARAEVPPSERIVILVGIDGFRWDYLDRLKPPTLSRMASEGVRADRMVPSFPSLTFPNFYTLVTGLRPEHHGIIGNNMYDPEWNASFSLGSDASREGRWWEGEPLWITAQKQGARAACMFWPGSEAEISGMRPWQWKPFDKHTTPEQRIKTVLDWVSLPPAERPRLVTLYFHEVDTASHKYGFESTETEIAVKEVDDAMAQLVEGIHQAGLDDIVNIVAVSDHGMTPVSPDRVVALSDIVKAPGVQVDFSGAVAGLRPPPDAVEGVYAALAARPLHYQVYRREEMPERLHFRAHRRIPPIVMIADEGWTITKRPLLDPAARGDFLRATHGFDPELLSMGASFIGWGKAFRQNVTLPPFDNVEIYPLVCAILGLKPAPNDSQDRLSAVALNPEPKQASAR